MKILNILKVAAVVLLSLGAANMHAQIGIATTGTASSKQILVLPNPFGSTLTVRFEKLDVRGRVSVIAVHAASGEQYVAHDVDPVAGVEMNATDFPFGNYEIRVIAPSSGAEIASTRAFRSQDAAALIAPSNQESTPERNGLIGIDEAIGDDGTVSASGARLPFIAYPNPFSEEIRIRIDAKRIRGNVNITLRHPQTGSVVYTGTADPATGEVVIETSAIPGGLFVLRIDTEHGEHLGNVQLMKK
jgi:hypothetical protein